MLTRDKLLQTGDQERIWQKYCGFLDLSLNEFMEIQEELLMQQIDLIYGSPLAKQFMPEKPKNVSEFRRLVPLTTYDDYADYLNEKNADLLPVKPYRWAHTSGRSGTFKWIPYTQKSVEIHSMYALSSLILACTDRKGEVNISNGARALANLPPPPYGAGVLVETISQLMDIHLMPPIGEYEKEDFATRTQIGFGMALRGGVDVLASLTTVLIKMGQTFAEGSGQLRFSWRMLNPQILRRLIIAFWRSKWEGRTILPKDLWPLKGLLAYGMDTSIYREQLIEYWGKEPLEFYAATETGTIATQAWNKKTMTFVPLTSFREFIPEAEWLRNREDKKYQPSTVLLDEVEPGKCYEVVVTCFHGLPFMRYRLGDLIRIVALEDEEAGIKLPQVAFESRADDIIDIAGFTRLDEKTIWQAITNTRVKYEDWLVRKEYAQNESILHLYIEPREEVDAEQLKSLIHKELTIIDRDYRDLESMLGIKPLRITLLSKDSFQRYYDEQRKAGADLAHLKPPHMNAPDTAVAELIKLGKNSSKGGL